MYTIIMTDENGDIFFLNHAYLSSLSFGSFDMAWQTEDKEKADLMLEKVERNNKHGAYAEYSVQEI